MSKRRADGGSRQGDDGEDASRIDAIGHDRNTNRDVAKWEKQMRDRLLQFGGEVLAAHLTKSKTEPKDMNVPPGALIVGNYLHDDGPILNDAQHSLQVRQKIARVEARLQKKNDKLLRNSSKLFQDESDRRGLLDGRPDPRAFDLESGEGQRQYQSDCTAQQRRITVKSREISDRIMGMNSLTGKIRKLRDKLNRLEQSHGDGESSDLRDDEYYKQVMQKCTSAKRG